MADGKKFYVPLDHDQHVMICAYCCKATPKSGGPMLCGGCRKTRYCSKECQTRAWAGGHKDECEPFDVAKRDLVKIVKRFRDVLFSGVVLVEMTRACSTNRRDAFVMQISDTDKEFSAMDRERIAEKMIRVPVVVVPEADDPSYELPEGKVALFLMGKATWRRLVGSQSAAVYEKEHVGDRLIGASLKMSIGQTGSYDKESGTIELYTQVCSAMIKDM